MTTTYRDQIGAFVYNEFDKRYDKLSERKQRVTDEDFAFAEFTEHVFGDVIARIVDEGKTPEEAMKFSTKYLNETFKDAVDCANVYF